MVLKNYFFLVQWNKFAIGECNRRTIFATYICNFTEYVVRFALEGNGASYKQIRQILTKNGMVKARMTSRELYINQLIDLAI